MKRLYPLLGSMMFMAICLTAMGNSIVYWRDGEYLNLPENLIICLLGLILGAVIFAGPYHYFTKKRIPSIISTLVIMTFYLTSQIAREIFTNQFFVPKLIMYIILLPITLGIYYLLAKLWNCGVGLARKFLF